MFDQPDSFDADNPFQLALSFGMRDDTTLENFYPLRNEPVVRQLELLAAGDGEPYLFLWGDNGAGCSHLLQASCHRAGALGRSAFYLPLDQLLGHGPSVLEGLESLDLVCIDQLQLAVGSPEWEEPLFHLFNRLRDAGCSLLIAADRPPRQLFLKLPDLASRLSWGLVFRIWALDDDGKCEALKARAQQRGIDLADDVAQFIMHRSPRQTGELFALLNQLDRASLAAQRRITIPFVKEVMDW